MVLCIVYLRITEKKNKDFVSKNVSWEVQIMAEAMTELNMGIVEAAKCCKLHWIFPGSRSWAFV